MHAARSREPQTGERRQPPTEGEEGCLDDSCAPAFEQPVRAERRLQEARLQEEIKMTKS